MSMQPDFDNDMYEALEHAERSEVVCVIMPFVNQCLVLDARYTADDPPTLTVSPPLGSAERRLRQVNKERPNLKYTRELAVIPWPGSVASLVNSSVWELMMRRMKAPGFPDADQACDDALRELQKWERQAMVTMISGQGPFQTLWPRTEAR